MTEIKTKSTIKNCLNSKNKLWQKIYFGRNISWRKYLLVNIKVINIQEFFFFIKPKQSEIEKRKKIINELVDLIKVNFIINNEFYQTESYAKN